jgi:Sec-independent protein translocase protein TatA
LKLASIEVLAMLTVLFILLLVLVIFGPRKLLHVATNAVPTKHPLEKLMSLMTGSVDADTQEVARGQRAILGRRRGLQSGVGGSYLSPQV